MNSTRCSGAWDWRPSTGLVSLFGAAITLAPYYFEPYFTPAELLALAVIVFSVRILGEREPQNRVETLGWTLFGLVYVPFMLQFLVRILLITSPHRIHGLVLGLWLIAVTKFCDIGRVSDRTGHRPAQDGAQHQPEKNLGRRGGRHVHRRGGGGRPGLGLPCLPAGKLHPPAWRP